MGSEDLEGAPPISIIEGTKVEIVIKIVCSIKLLTFVQLNILN